MVGNTWCSLLLIVICIRLLRVYMIRVFLISYDKFGLEFSGDSSFNVLFS